MLHTATLFESIFIIFELKANSGKTFEVNFDVVLFFCDYTIDNVN